MAYMRMKMPNPGAASPRVRLQGLCPCSVVAGSAACRSPLRYCPARGGGRGAGRLGFPGQTPRRGVRSVAHAWTWTRLAARL